ncbi:GAF domain-containing protein [Candidatus Bathyarchaeota archaeon]|nr:GAF domain-containing protein [Candidatus Bathyarchaeota archaeon]
MTAKILVLHIDDDLDQLKFTKLFLERVNDRIHVESETDPAMAVERLRNGSFDCIVCDYKMPRLSGIDLAGKMREFSDLPFILYTGHGSEEVAEAAFAAGVSDYMRKETDPSHYQVLANRITAATDTYRNEKEARTTRQLMAVFMDSATEGFSILDSDFNYIDVNRTVLQRIGLRREDFIGKNLVDLFPDVRESGRLQNYIHVLETGEAYSAEIIDRSYSQRYLLVKAFKVGEGLGFITTDLTRLRTFETRLNALYQSATRLGEAEGILKISDISIGILRDVLEYKIGSIGFITGDEAVFHRSIEFDFPDKFKIPLSARSVVARAVRERKTQIVEDTRLDPDYLDVEVSGYDIDSNLSEIAVPVLLDGVPVAVFNVEDPETSAFDEEDQKLLDTLASHIASSIRRLRELQENKRHHEQLHALNRHVLSLNQADNVDMVAKVTLDIMSQVFGEGFLSFQLLKDGHLHTIDARGAPSIGVPLPLDGKGVTTRAAREARAVYVSNTRDDSDFIQVFSGSQTELAVPVIHKDEVLAVLNMESPSIDAFSEEDVRLLEILAMHVGTSLFRQRQEQELRRVSDENLSNTMEGLERVTRMMRHDLRSPLQSISNAAQMIELEPDSAQEMITIIGNNVQYAVEILDDLRTLSAPKSIVKEPVEIDELLRRSLESRILPRNIDAKMSLGSGATTPIDKTKMTRVIDNLINNAIEAMPNGGILTIDAHVDGDEIIIEISDEGQGIPDESMYMVFRPFFSTKTTGMGLGLTYCKEVAEAHGGSIHVASKENEGTKITVRLPIK